MKANRSNIIFVTGTDTGVGKTTLAGLLVYHLRQTGTRALAIKPFCSGGREDVILLREMQDKAISESEINPYFFKEPVAPLVSLRRMKKDVKLTQVISHIKKIASECDQLIVEGAGGLLVPLGEGYTVADLIKKLKCQVIVVAMNKLGCINHTMLTVSHLRGITKGPLSVVLMNGGQGKDLSTKTNEKLLAEQLGSVHLHALPFLGTKVNEARELKKSYRKVKITLAEF